MIHNKNRIEKLPKWAQHHIQKLEADNKDLRGQIDAISTGKSLITWHVVWSHEGTVGIPEQATVKFETETGAIEVSLRNKEMSIFANRTLLVIPRASNAIRLQVDTK